MNTIEKYEWSDIRRIWDKCGERKHMSPKKALEAWKKDAPALGMCGNEWDLKDFRKYIAYLNGRINWDFANEQWITKEWAKNRKKISVK